MVIVNIFGSRKISVSYLWFILFISIAASFALTAAGFLIQKEIRIVLSSVFIITNVFLFSAFSVITFSSNLKAVFLKSLLVLVILFFAGMTFIFICVLSFSDDSETYINGDGKADAGVILGAAVWGGNRPSPVLRDRINKGYDIYIKGGVPKLVITGGGSPNEMTEAEVSKNALIKYGVDPQNLIVENESNSTVEQIHFVRDKLYKKRNWKKIVIISDNFHLMRSKENYYLKESFALIIFWMCGI
jgi:vancomycin permeability regulator SanA